MLYKYFDVLMPFCCFFSSIMFSMGMPKAGLGDLFPFSNNIFLES